MTEYWQSQSRKYCDFCKCWFADNKVSISFHENGKRHKENLQKHISQLGKRSAKEFKQKEKMEDDIKKMEEAAMAAYLKDVQNNADLTSKYINETLVQTGASSKNLTVEKPTKASPIWHEVKNDDGGFYYWNTVTNETTWEPPEDYLTLAQLEKQKLHKKNEKADKKQMKDKGKEYKKEGKEQIKEPSVKKTEPAPTKSFGPLPQPAKPYGTWTTIIKEPEQKIDLQLPKSKLPPEPPVVVEPEPEPVVVFTEKKIESVVEEPVEFKRRKFNFSRRNVRQRLNDD